MIANTFITKLEHSPKKRTNNEQSPVIDVTYNVLPKKNENKFVEPCISTRKRLRSRDCDDVSSPGKYFTIITKCPNLFYCLLFFDKQNILIFCAVTNI